MLLSKFFLLALMVLCYALILQTAYTEVIFFFKGYIALYFLYAFVYFMFLQLYGGLRLGILRIPELTFSNAVASVIANFIIYFAMSLITYSLLSVWPLLLCCVAQILLGALGYVAGTRLHHRLYPPKDAVMVISDDAHDARVAEKFSSGYTRYIIKKTVSERELDADLSALQGYSAVLTGNVEPLLRDRLMDYCFSRSKQLFIIPRVADIMLNSAAYFTADDVFLYLCRNKCFTPDQLAVKRMMDIVISACILLLTSPILLLTALAIKIQDGGPVFYRQTRLTRNRKQFELIKFRSMVVDAEKYTGAVLAREGDPRITPVGRIIRAARIDELPQLWNIIKGDMSLVGPRPERPELFEQTIKKFPQFAYRLKVKAGLTGYAQLYGKYNTSFEDKVRLDLLYIERASLFQDMQLLFYTLKIVFMKESTEGVEVHDAEKM